jgi:NADH-quinone oxidoreductase subunit G
VQSFHACARPLDQARPAWKVLRVLGTMLGRQGFDFDTIEQVREACLGGRDVGQLLHNGIDAQAGAATRPGGIERIAEVPIYFADPLVRRSPSLQKTRDARAPRAWMNARLLHKLGVADGQPVRVRQGEGSATLAAALDDRLPDDCVRVAAAHATTAPLGPMFGTVEIERITAEKAA